MDYTQIEGNEQAHILNDKLRAVQMRHLQLTASKLAGEDVDEGELGVLEERANALKEAVEAATAQVRR